MNKLTTLLMFTFVLVCGISLSTVTGRGVPSRASQRTVSNAYATFCATPGLAVLRSGTGDTSAAVTQVKAALATFQTQLDLYNLQPGAYDAVGEARALLKGAEEKAKGDNILHPESSVQYAY